MNLKKLCALSFIALQLIGGAVFYHRESRYIEGFVEVPARIVEIHSRRVTEPDGRQYSADVQGVVVYRLGSQEHRFRTRFFGLPRWQEGEQVTALVSLHEPDTGRVKRADDLYPLTIGMLAWAGLNALFYLLIGRRSGRRCEPGMVRIPF